MITLHTNHGDIEIELNFEKAPLTAANFARYCKDGHYNGTIFHRVIDNFMIQGGGFEPGMQRRVPQHPPIANEATNGMMHEAQRVELLPPGAASSKATKRY